MKNVKALIGAFNQEKALVGAFSIIVQQVVEPMDRFTALAGSETLKQVPIFRKAVIRRRQLILA